MSEEVPAGWTAARIGDVCRLVNGRAFKPVEWTTAGLPIIRIQNLNDSNAPFNHFAGRLDPKHRVEHGDLLFAWSGTPGTSFGAHIWRGPEAALNQHIYRIMFSETQLDKRFLRLAINQRLDDLVHAAHGGAGLAHVTKPVFEQTEITFPPLAQQRHIVEKLEALLTQVNVSRERLTRVRDILKRFRQSVLDTACSGRLTEEWRASSLTAGAEGELETSTNSTDIPPTWKVEQLGTIAVVGTGATPLRKRRDYYGGAIPWLRSACVNDDPVLQADEYITDVAIAETNAKLFPVGTLLMAMYGEGATRGKVTELGIAAATNQALAAIILRPQQAELRSYLKFALRAQYQTHRELSAGGVQPNLSLTLIRDMVVPVPPPAERGEIVRRVEMLFRLADAIESTLSAAADCAGRLPAAILAKAFRGQVLST